jgi:hypothetical protein
MVRSSHRLLHLLAGSVLLAGAFATSSVAEVRVALPTSGLPEVQCSYCEDSDRSQRTALSCMPKTVENYCSCKSEKENPLRVLLRTKRNAPLIDFVTYEKQQLDTVKKKLQKQRRSKKDISKRLGQLRKKLKAQHEALTKACLPAVGGSRGDVDQIAKIRDVPGFVWYRYTSKQHTYFRDITEKGAILGGSYSRSIVPPQAGDVTNTLSGLSRSQQLKMQVTPFILNSNGLTKVCDNCPVGLSLESLNDNGLAIGNVPSASNQQFGRAVVYTSRTKSLEQLPTINGKEGSATAVNEAGAVIGDVDLGAAGASTQSDAAMWVNGTAFLLNRTTILAEHKRQFAPIVLEAVKADLKERQEFNECSDGEIAATRLVGDGRFLSEPALLGADINNRGDVVGTVTSAGLLWDFSGPCTSGPFSIMLDHSIFTLYGNGQLLVTPVRGPTVEQNRVFAPTSINNLRQILGVTSLISLQPQFKIGLLDVSSSGRPVTELSVPMFANHSFFAAAQNDKQDIVGQFYPAQAGQQQSRAFLVSNGAFIDLNSVIGNDPEWELQTAAQVNNCGQIVGRAFHKPTGLSQGYLLSPPRCPVVN